MPSEPKRKIIDCRDFPNEIGCTLLISGSPKELLTVAVKHAVDEHGHQDTPGLRKQIKALMKDETKYNLNKYSAKKSINKSNKKKGSSK
jgi:hypothetical protein